MFIEMWLQKQESKQMQLFMIYHTSRMKKQKMFHNKVQFKKQKLNKKALLYVYWVPFSYKEKLCEHVWIGDKF